MDKDIILKELTDIANSGSWNVRKNLLAWIEKVKEVYIPRQRTSTQNNALHLWFHFLAEALNEAGYTVQLVLKEKMDLDWDSDKVKELLWRPAQQAILGKKSTTELSKIEDIDKVYEHINRHLGEKFGIHIEFPHNEINQTNYRQKADEIKINYAKD